MSIPSILLDAEGLAGSCGYVQLRVVLYLLGSLLFNLLLACLVYPSLVWNFFFDHSTAWLSYKPYSVLPMLQRV